MSDRVRWASILRCARMRARRYGAPICDGVTRWVKVTAFGMLAERTAASVGKGDRVTVLADDVMAEAWAANGSVSTGS